MSINRFSLWEFCIGGAATLAVVILTGSPLRAALLVLLALALAAAAVARNVLAFFGTFLAVWVALPLWAPAIPGETASQLPTVGQVIGSTSTTEPASPAGAEADTPTTTEPEPAAELPVETEAVDQ